MADTKESKKVIKVQSVASPRTVTPKDGPETQVLEFMGEDKLKYEAWGPELAEVITKGAELVSDITHTSRQSQEGPVDVHRVTQIYIEGKQVRPPQRRAGAGGSAARSPEERASTESQVAACITASLYNAGKLQEDDPLVKDLRAWVAPRLKQPITQPPVEKKAEATEQKAKAATAPPKTPGDAEERPGITADQLKQLGTLATNKGYEPSLVSGIIQRKFQKAKASDLTEAEGKELIGIMQRGDYLQPQGDLPF